MCCSRAEAHGGHSSDPKDQVLGGETGPRHTLGRIPRPGNGREGHGSAQRGAGERSVLSTGEGFRQVRVKAPRPGPAGVRHRVAGAREGWWEGRTAEVVP